METFTPDHVQLAMPKGQERAAKAFYAGVLGFEEMPKPPELAKRGGAWFRAGSPAKRAHPALRCTDYAALLERLAARGVVIVEYPLPLDGKRHCYIADPFGNRIEIIDGSHEA